MPDDRPLTLGAVPAPPELTPSAPPPQVMARLLRLPTTSRIKARAIVRLQLDRLSPLPPAETVFDLVMVRRAGTEGVFALGVVRKADLARPEFDGQRTILLNQEVEGVAAVFRFANPAGAGLKVPDWLRHAPSAAVLAGAFALVAMAAAHRSAAWTEQELPRIAAEGEARAAAALLATEQQAARADWGRLERGDAATRLQCVLDRLGESEGEVALMGLTAEAGRVVLTLQAPVDEAALDATGAELQSEGETDGPTTAIYEGGACG